ncbi:uncharacterized protein LOC126382128 isoform X1 [Pectinophora gossypiella]|uniref:uncharacterized protein LOC126382128 isoform X1 n=1 Tax=Pectinophora gossypiella TaxID=13191 RepID=UPI00214EFBA1|nr:uncharacterized protein LOC126382128 isoform X1 [Pectinophora gossypiella]
MFRLLLYCLVFNLFGKSQSSNDNSTTPLHNVTTPPHTPPPHTPPHNSTLHHTPPDNTTPHRAEPHHTSTAAPTQPHPSPTHAVSSVPITFPTVTTSKATQPVSATIQSTIPPTTEQTTAVTAVPTDKPRPITLTVIPDIHQIEEENHNHLTCTISGTNLPKIKPYKLCWYTQGDGGKNNMIIHKNNAQSITIVLTKSFFRKYQESVVYCAVVFYQRSPTHYWMIKTHYVQLNAAKSKSDTQATNHLVIVSITGVVGALLLGLMAGFLIKRFRNAKTRTPHISEEPSMSAQDNVYSYVPLETVSFYQAKALAASNTPKSMESVGPPPLPERPRQERTINEEEEYIYSYAYGIKTPQSYNP